MTGGSGGGPSRPHVGHASGMQTAAAPAWGPQPGFKAQGAAAPRGPSTRGHGTRGVDNPAAAVLKSVNTALVQEGLDALSERGLVMLLCSRDFPDDKVCVNGTLFGSCDFAERNPDKGRCTYKHESAEVLAARVTSFQRSRAGARLAGALQVGAA